MFIVFDYRCPECGYQEERFVRRSEMDSQACPNFVTPTADKPCFSSWMTRLPAGTRTHFRFADTKLKG